MYKLSFWGWPRQNYWVRLDIPGNNFVVLAAPKAPGPGWPKRARVLPPSLAGFQWLGPLRC